MTATLAVTIKSFYRTPQIKLQLFSPSSTSPTTTLFSIFLHQGKTFFFIVKFFAFAPKNKKTTTKKASQSSRNFACDPPARPIAPPSPTGGRPREGVGNDSTIKSRPKMCRKEKKKTLKVRDFNLINAVLLPLR